MYNITITNTQGKPKKGEKVMRTLNSKVLTIANKLVKEGYNRANAMVKAWILAKMPVVETTVSGVTYGKRQTAIEHLTYYKPEQIRIILKRDKQNQYDHNAIAVIAAVESKGAYCVGYLPKALAAFLAPLMDAGKAVYSAFMAVRGCYEPYMNYGLSILIKM